VLHVVSIPREPKLAAHVEEEEEEPRPTEALLLLLAALLASLFAAATCQRVRSAVGLARAASSAPASPTALRVLLVLAQHTNTRKYNG